MNVFYKGLLLTGNHTSARLEIATGKSASTIDTGDINI